MQQRAFRERRPLAREPSLSRVCVDEERRHVGDRSSSRREAPSPSLPSRAPQVEPRALTSSSPLARSSRARWSWALRGAMPPRAGRPFDSSRRTRLRRERSADHAGARASARRLGLRRGSSSCGGWARRSLRRAGAAALGPYEASLAGAVTARRPRRCAATSCGARASSPRWRAWLRTPPAHREARSPSRSASKGSFLRQFRTISC